MEYLNKNLTLEECLELLNKMAKNIIDRESCGPEIVHITIAPEEIGTLEQLLGSEEKVVEYLKEFDHEDWEEDGFDIVPIWDEICAYFNADIWVRGNDDGGEFYVFAPITLDDPSKSELERLFNNLKVFVNNGIFEDYFNSIIPENTDIETLAELNEILEDEMSCWG